jgi:phage terminase large subunit-like protein
MISPTWTFDKSPIADPHGRGERAVRFMENLRHPSSAEPGKRFKLPYFWDRVTRAIEGPSDAHGNRLVRTAYIQIPRGARKTTYGAALGLLHTLGYERPLGGGRAILSASAEDQAELAFDEVKGFINSTPALKKAAHLVPSELLMEHHKSGSWLRAIPAEGDTEHGKTPTFVLVDELHVWKNRKLWRALKSGLFKVPNTLLIIITTAGRGQDNLAFEEYQYAKKVASGEIVNPAYLPIIFEPPKNYDWRDEKIWHAVNPGLRYGWPDLTGMRVAAREAENKPADRDDFRQYNLNEWLDHSASPFVDMAVYDRGSAPIDLKDLAGRPCWIGVDMSTTTDLTAVVAAFRDPADDDGFIVLPHFFVPKDNLQKKAEIDGVPYPGWAQEKLLTATPGNVIDYRAVENYIRDLDATYDVREINFDPAYAQPVMGPLGDDGLPVQTMRQGWVTQSPALNELERAIVAGKFQHGAHPVLRWCFSNVAIHTDSAGNRTMHKGKSTDRIDGAVATWMAVARAAAGESNVSQ